MDDTISRQAAIDKFEPWLKVDGYSEGELNMLKAVLYELRVMPSAQRWIPCGERLPEPGVNVLVDVADIPAGGRFPLIDEICKDGEWLNCDGSEWLALAWMPIPDPWKGEQNGEKR